MDGHFSGQAAQRAGYPPPPAMIPGEGPVANFLQHRNLNAQTQNHAFASTASHQTNGISRPQGSRTQSNNDNPNSPPTLEHWTITKYDLPPVTTPGWKVSQRHNDNMPKSQIKATLKKQSKAFKTPLTLNSPQVSSVQKQQIEDFVIHRNQYDLNPYSEWVLKAIDQTTKKGKVKAIQVIIVFKKLNNPRQVRPANIPYQWRDVHSVGDPRVSEEQQRIEQHHRNHLNAQQAWSQSQPRPEANFSTMPKFNGQNHATNMQQHGRTSAQMDQMSGQIRDTAPSRTAAQNAPKQAGMAYNSAGSNHQHPDDRTPPKVAATKPPTASKPRGQGAPKPKPVIHYPMDSDDSSQADDIGWDNASNSEGESAPTDYSSQGQSSPKVRNMSQEPLHRTTNGRNGKETTYKNSSRGSATSKQDSRRGQPDSSSDDDSSPGDSFIGHSKARHQKAKGDERPSREPQIRQHERPVGRGASPSRSSRTYSHPPSETRPHRSSKSHKAPSRHRGYSVESLSSSSKDKEYYLSPRQSTYGIQHPFLLDWTLEQGQPRLEMEREMRLRQLEQPRLEMEHEMRLRQLEQPRLEMEHEMRIRQLERNRQRENEKDMELFRRLHRREEYSY